MLTLVLRSILGTHIAISSILLHFHVIFALMDFGLYIYSFLCSKVTGSIFSLSSLLGSVWFLFVVFSLSESKVFDCKATGLVVFLIVHKCKQTLLTIVDVS